MLMNVGLVRLQGISQTLVLTQPLEAGLTAQVKRFVEDPHDPLRDQLAPGEQVVAEFDVCKLGSSYRGLCPSPCIGLTKLT